VVQLPHAQAAAWLLAQLLHAATVVAVPQQIPERTLLHSASASGVAPLGR
jgi:hypothetical protein